MTRKEALSQLFTNYHNDGTEFRDVDYLIHLIYDDFEVELKNSKKWGLSMRDEAHKFNKELQHIKNRTCSNCKFNEICVYIESVKHTNQDEFYCSDWESKNESIYRQ